MDEKLIFRRLGKRGHKEIEPGKILDGVMEVKIYSECFKLYKLKGRPRTIMHEWVFEDVCKNKKVNLEKIMWYPEKTREEILDEWYGKEYLEEESWEILKKEIKIKNIPMSYGD